MTDKIDTSAAAVEEVIARLKKYDEFGPLSCVALHPETPGYSTGGLFGDAANARDMILALAAERDALQAAIKRQSGAARTLRIHTLAEVQHLKDMDRSEYIAAKTVEGEREANAILTEENDALRAEVERLRDAIKRADDEIFGVEVYLGDTLSGPSNDMPEGTDKDKLIAWLIDGVSVSLDRAKSARAALKGGDA